MAPTRMDSLLEELCLSHLIAKNVMWPSDHRRLSAVKMDNLYDNAIHSAMECVLSVYLSKNKFLNN